MKVQENERNMVIIEQGGFTYLISYRTPIAKVCNIIETDPKKNNYYGLYLIKDWDYSNTTLKQLYYFIETYTTQRDDTGNMIAYMVGNKNNKKKYIKKLIEKNYIKLIERKDM